jgi:hypothetical protein
MSSLLAYNAYRRFALSDNNSKYSTNTAPDNSVLAANGSADRCYGYLHTYL